MADIEKILLNKYREIAKKEFKNALLSLIKPILSMYSRFRLTKPMKNKLSLLGDIHDGVEMFIGFNDQTGINVNVFEPKSHSTDILNADKLLKEINERYGDQMVDLQFLEIRSLNDLFSRIKSNISQYDNYVKVNAKDKLDGLKDDLKVWNISKGIFESLTIPKIKKMSMNELQNIFKRKKLKIEIF
ncbi:MAG: hypothetical protein ACFFG0_20780 [Candidatus Thorarchaeota archaeon]